MTTALKARPTTYNWTKMRSRFEARVAAWLDGLIAHGVAIAWEYEPRAFATQHGQYLPDFLILGVSDHEGNDRPLYLEIKGELPAVLASVLERMNVIQASEPDAMAVAADERMLQKGFVVFTDYYMALIALCRNHNRLLLLREWEHSETWLGRCSKECDGVGYSRHDTRAGLPRWDAKAVQPQDYN